MSGGDDDDPPPVERPEEELQKPVDAADPKQQKRRRAAKQYQEAQYAVYLRKVLADEEGRRFLWSILEGCHTFDERYGFGPTGVPNDAATQAFRGQRDLGLSFYFQWSKLDRAGVLLMHDENDPRFKKGS